MIIRTSRTEDLPEVLALTITVFGPFYEDSYRPRVGDRVFLDRHGDWRADYARHVAAVHDPGQGRHAAVAHLDDRIAGYVAWVVHEADRHGEIDILAVSPDHRRRGVGRALLDHAQAHLKSAGVTVVSIGTGGDAFHAPARALYESLGHTPFPTVNYTKVV
ncbi:hypothetical protein GCM10022243_25830 [Saccharothrix violaceirubra]|uniref:Ribosomal protein S18 acetylase RimI-like enzyme n=1 Tax=Saccharothrix violaceirubra TaxID=413306 RepID=A0A7W7T3T4_9PSEU|nr:GNAT family N-acetyltransferase [Saccharothrix violaceirubra]MBB4966070.1 ribosomal protein S18 acetylase RimI-like enzyme [Saccharothrix violaceirubra]